MLKGNPELELYIFFSAIWTPVFFFFGGGFGLCLVKRPKRQGYFVLKLICQTLE